MSGHITIRVELPQPINDIGDLLGKLADIWPDVKVDFSSEDGWRINIPAREGVSPRKAF